MPKNTFSRLKRRKKDNDWVFIKGDKWYRGPYPDVTGLYKVRLGGKYMLRETYAYYYAATASWAIKKDMAEKIIAWKRM